MKLIKTGFVSVLIVSFAFAGTYSDTNAIDVRYDACLANGDSTTASMANCTYQATEEWDVELNKNYKTLKKQFNKKQKKALLATQRAWLKFRDSEMKLMNATATGGTIDKLLKGGRYLELEKQRALDLKSYIQDSN